MHPWAAGLNVPSVASIAVTCETADHSLENAFDQRRGPGGSRWVAETPGEQTLLLGFDAPKHIRQVWLEVEETRGLMPVEFKRAS